LNLKKNSNNYVYEDAWNVENSRPLIEKVLVKNDEVDRSNWHAKVLEKHPCIQELKERIYPLWRAVSFGQTFNAGRKDVVDKLDDQIITQLIYQHLRFEGLKNTKKALEDESGLPAKHIDVDQSLIHAHIKEAIKRTEKIYDTVIGDKLPPKNRKNKAEILKDIDEKLGDIGIEDESTFGSENTNVDIWDDSKIKENVFIETDPISRISTFRGASLNHLIVRLTDKNVEDYNTYLPIFLVTYQSFTTTEILITKLIERAHPPQNIEDSKAEDIKDMIIRVFRSLLTDHFSHFNPRILTRLMSYIKEDYEKKSTDKLIGSEFEALIQKSMIGNSLISNPVDPPKPKVNTISQTKENIFHHELFILDVDEEEIARQLSLIDYELFCVIRSEEFLNRNWDQTKTKHRAPNIIRMIDHFNDISTWITSLIVTCPDVKERRNRLTKCLKLSQHLKDMNSFDSFHAVLNGLFDPTIRRLKHTIDGLPNTVKEVKQNIP
jgi:son of sevenless